MPPSGPSGQWRGKVGPSVDQAPPALGTLWPKYRGSLWVHEPSPQPGHGCPPTLALLHLVSCPRRRATLHSIQSFAIHHEEEARLAISATATTEEARETRERDDRGFWPATPTNETHDANGLTQIYSIRCLLLLPTTTRPRVGPLHDEAEKDPSPPSARPDSVTQRPQPRLLRPAPLVATWKPSPDAHHPSPPPRPPPSAS